MNRKHPFGRTAVATILLMAGTCVAPGVQAQNAGAAEQTARADSEHVQEVVVTAQRREEPAQRSSVAIEVVEPAQLESAGVTQATDLANVVPGLTVSQGGATTQTYLRGVGSFATDASAESSIAYNLNGVYISRPNAIGPIFFDLARVEVLRGPQGTLYGRNASGGAINLITNRPTQEFAGRLSLEAGNFDLAQATGVINVPAGDTLAFRAAGQYVDRDGYLSDGYDDQDSQAGRLLALWNPNEATSLLITGEYTQIGGKGAGVVRRSTLQPVPSDPWTGPSDPASQPPTAFIPNGTRILDDGTTDVISRALSAELNWELPFATLTFIPAVRNADIAYLTYTPAFRFDTTETSEQQSYELRLAGSSDSLNWVGGLFYFDEDQTELYFLTANPIQQSSVDIDLSSESWAAFGQATFTVTDTLRLIGGLRYSEEDKSQTGQTIAVLPVPSTTDNAGARTFDDVSWKAGVEYDLAPQSMLFFTAATGFKAGGFFPSVLAPNNSYDPEELLAYTLGSRNRFLDQRLQVNLEAFYWDYEDKQERFLSVTTAGTTGLLTTNAGAATLYGAHLDVEFAATPNDRLRFSAEYLSSEYDEFSYTAYNPTGGSYPAEATGCALGAPAPLPTSPNPIDTVQPIDCAGQDLVRAPEWSGFAGYNRIFNFDEVGRLVAGVSTVFSSSQFLSPDFITSGTDDGFATANADITFYSRDERWSLSAWGHNLTDEAIYTGGFRYPFSRPVAQGGDPTLYYPNIRPPRTYGVRFNVQF